MIKTVDISTVSIVVASAGVFIAAIYYVLQLRHQIKLRETDFVHGLYSQFSTKEFVEARQKLVSLEYKDYEDFVKKYGPPFSETPAQTALIMTCMFLEGVGYLVSRKLVKVDVIADLISVEMLWKKVEPMIQGWRKQLGSPRIFEWTEYLYNEVKKKEQRGVNSG